MSVELKFEKGKATATFKNRVEENEITNAFIEITETVSIKKINYIILDFSDIVSYTIPKNYMDILKMITHFSSNWNSNIKVVNIATNPEIRKVVSEIIKVGDQISWEYVLFEDLASANNWLVKS